MSHLECNKFKHLFCERGKIIKHENEMQSCKWTSLSSRLFDKSEDFCNMIPLSCKSNWTPRLLQQKVDHLKHRSFKFLPKHRRTTVRQKTIIYTSFNQSQGSRPFECDVINHHWLKEV